MKGHKFFALFLISWFVFLCFFHYLTLRPLWLDESLILENIKTQSIPQLLGPLKKGQSFPRTYLIAIKLFAEKFNYHPLALRFFPLISGLAAFFVWLAVYKKEISAKINYLLVLAALSSSYYFTYYAAELKQYSMDVFVVGAFSFYILSQKQLQSTGPSKRFVFFTCVLPLTILFSQASFFVFWIVGYNFLFLAKKNLKIRLLLAVYSTISALAASFVFMTDIRHTLSCAGLVSYWKSYFLCSDSFYCFMKSFGEGVQRLSVWWFGNTVFLKRAASFVIPLFVLSLFGYGAGALRRGRLRIFDLDSLGLVIFLELFVLGMMKKYPFTGERITLFFAPFAFYFTAKGIDSLRRSRFLYFPFLISYLGLLLIGAASSFLAYFKMYSTN